MNNDVDRLMREVKRAASLYVAAKAANDYRKMVEANEKLADLSINYLERGGNLDELAITLASGQGKGE